ncbi:hypothetical protein PHJA_000352300 [Phtheirospermum japonicum]|uniref:Uncharacterized protein n=1 Tax=Phtheirospermum japonicum TaxID=374723 RepID=A0A830B343_9LAMI|nr:hypothetical protein PHJA_000352300 [Phtheirospermum japonicum]
MSEEVNPSISRLLVLTSHLQTSSSSSSFSQTAMASEKEAALAAVPSDSPTIFDKILNKQIPANIVYEDDKGKVGNESSINLGFPLVHLTSPNQVNVQVIHRLAYNDNFDVNTK